MGRSKDIASAYDARAVTPSDSTEFAETRGLYVGTTGDIAVRTAYGTDITFKTVPVGILPVQVIRVLSTGTTASNIIALY